MFSICCAGVTVIAERAVKPIRHGLQEAAGSTEQRYKRKSYFSTLAVFTWYALNKCWQVNVCRAEHLFWSMEESLYVSAPLELHGLTRSWLESTTSNDLDLSTEGSISLWQLSLLSLTCTDLSPTVHHSILHHQSPPSGSQAYDTLSLESSDSMETSVSTGNSACTPERWEAASVSMGTLKSAPSLRRGVKGLMKKPLSPFAFSVWLPGMSVYFVQPKPCCYCVITHSSPLCAVVPAG